MISGSEILPDKATLTLQGHGTCIGKAVPGIELKIAEASDIPRAELIELPLNTVGEIVVSGKQVTPAYFEMEEETKKAKINVDGKLWHRMGDLGYLDEDKNLWFLGRMAHRVEVDSKTTLYPMQIEAIFNQHPEVKRTALIKGPALVIERHDGRTKADQKFFSELRLLGQQTDASRGIKDFFLYPAFPVDVRHNIKIDRLKLSLWQQKKQRPVG